MRSRGRGRRTATVALVIAGSVLAAVPGAEAAQFSAGSAGELASAIRSANGNGDSQNAIVITGDIAMGGQRLPESTKTLAIVNLDGPIKAISTGDSEPLLRSGSGDGLGLSGLSLTGPASVIDAGGPLALDRVTVNATGSSGPAISASGGPLALSVSTVSGPEGVRFDGSGSPAEPNQDNPIRDAAITSSTIAGGVTLTRVAEGTRAPSGPVVGIDNTQLDRAGLVVDGAAGRVEVSSTTAAGARGDGFALRGRITGDTRLSQVTSSGGAGAGVTIDSATRTTVANSTIADNRGAGIARTGAATAATDVSSSVVAGNAGGDLTAAGGAGPINVGLSFIGGAPGLGPLGANGGRPQTRIPDAGSPLIDRGIANGLRTDARQAQRTLDDPGVPNGPGSDGTDIGAVERAVPPPPPPGPVVPPPGPSSTSPGAPAGVAIGPQPVTPRPQTRRKSRIRAKRVRQVRLRGRTLRVPWTTVCGDGVCTVLNRVERRVVTGKGKRKKTRTIVMGTRRFTMVSNQRRRVVVPLSASAVRKYRRGKSRRVTLDARITDGEGVVVRVRRTFRLVVR